MEPERAMNNKEFSSHLKTTEKLNSAVHRAVELHNRLLKENGLPCGDDDIWYSNDIHDFDEDGVCISWSVTWAYGGYDDGTHTIPSEALLDETYEAFITNLVEQKAAEFKDRQEKKRAAERAADKAEIERLTKKLEQQ